MNTSLCEGKGGFAFCCARPVPGLFVAAILENFCSTVFVSFHFNSEIPATAVDPACLPTHHSSHIVALIFPISGEFENSLFIERFFLKSKVHVPSQKVRETFDGLHFSWDRGSCP